ncbi:MAG TPA: alkyl hydroperoxide reductase [Planctomycetota bacterium]|nr:alkyl hydroperoxide reductase [Planctomycetota bacterium]
MRLVPVLAAMLCPAIGLARGQSPAPAAVPLGAVVDAPFTDLRWQTRALRELGDVPATVLFFATIDCPLVQRYLPRIGELAVNYRERGVVVLVVNVGPGDGLVDAAGQVAAVAPAAVFGKDFELALARACGVDRTAAAVVLDRGRHLVYRGRVDDQFAYAGARLQPAHHELADAIDAVLAGRAVATAETAVSGCLISAPGVPGDTNVPTFARDIAPVLQQHCQECHRPGGEAPFPLLDEAQAKKHAAMIGEVVTQGRMPPWYGSSAYGSFVNHRGLSPAERERVAAWVRGGMPSGDAADLPPQKALPHGGWRIGEPDLVIEIKAPIRLPADGIVPYKYFILPHRFDEDTWVEAIEIRPSNERVLHHCNLARVKFGEKFSQDGFVTGYVPGGDAMVMDAGTAVRIPAGSVLALQAHYVTTGEPEQDRLSVGLRFPRTVVQKEMQVAIAANFRFEIPPGAMAHPVHAARTLPADAIGIGMFVHMHLRGRDMKVTAEAPDGTEETLLLVPNYNFDWQQSYRWAPACKQFARGTKIRALAHYDNSAWNPFNPDPSQTVKFGLETADEMMYLFLFWVARDEALGLHVDVHTGRVLDDADRGR